MRGSTSFQSHGSRAQGWFLVGFGLISFLVFVYAAIFSKFVPVSEHNVATAIRNDRYYCFLVPLTIPAIFVVVYFHWFSIKFFKHA